MKMLVFSDVHVHTWPAFSSVDERGINDRLRDTLRTIEQVGRIAVEEEVDLIVFAGDLFHMSKLDAVTLALTSKALEALDSGRPILAIEGNHDQVSRVRSLTSVSGLRVPPNWTWLRRDDYQYRGIKFWGTAYGDKEPPEALPDVAIIHRGVEGAELSDYFVSGFEDDFKPNDARKWAKRLVICGHYHKPGVIPQMAAARQVEVLIPGAPLQHTWGDAGQERGVWIVELLDKDVKAKLRVLESFPRFLKITEENVEALDEAEGNFVSVEFQEALPKEDLDAIAAGLKEKARGFSIRAEEPKLERPTEDRIEVREGADLEEIVRAYAAKFGGENPKLLTETGMGYLRAARKEA